MEIEIAIPSYHVTLPLVGGELTLAPMGAGDRALGIWNTTSDVRYLGCAPLLYTVDQILTHLRGPAPVLFTPFLDSPYDSRLAIGSAPFSFAVSRSGSEQVMFDPSDSSVWLDRLVPLQALRQPMVLDGVDSRIEIDAFGGRAYVWIAHAEGRRCLGIAPAWSFGTELPWDLPTPQGRAAVAPPRRGSYYFFIGQGIKTAAANGETVCTVHFRERLDAAFQADGRDSIEFRLTDSQWRTWRGQLAEIALL